MSLLPGPLVDRLLMLQTETQQDKCWPDGPRGLCADSTSTSDLLFASILDQMIVQNIPYE